MGSAELIRNRTFVRLQMLCHIAVIGFVILVIPSQSFATSAIAAQVAAACAPNPTMPDVGSCSACHSTTNNRGPNDLTAAGQWSLSPSTYMNFCPTATPAPPPTPTPTPTPTPPVTPPPGSPTTPGPSPTPGMGGSGAPDDDDDGDSDDDDDDGGPEADDDDDGGSSAAGSFSSRLSAFRQRLRTLFLNRGGL